MHQPGPFEQWRYYETARGQKTVFKELAALPPAAQAALSSAMERLQQGKAFDRDCGTIGEGHVDGEVRATSDGCEYRLLYGRVARYDQVLLGLVVIDRKKKRKTPRNAIKTANDRYKDWIRQGKG